MEGRDRQTDTDGDRRTDTDGDREAQLPMEVVGSPSMEGVPELRRRGTEGRGQWAWWGGLGLGLGILEVFSYLGDSMVLGVDTGITGLGHSGCVFACG